METKAQFIILYLNDLTTTEYMTSNQRQGIIEII